MHSWLNISSGGLLRRAMSLRIPHSSEAKCFYGYGPADVLWGTFWHICIISTRVRFHSIFPAWCTSVKSDVNKSKGSWNCSQSRWRIMRVSSSSFPQILQRPLPKWQKAPVAPKQKGASRAPWSLLHLLLFTANLCFPCSISSDTTASHAGGRTKDVTVCCRVFPTGPALV